MNPVFPAGPCLLDTSALVKAYVLEEGSNAVDLILQGSGPIFVSSLAVLEAISAFQRLHSIEHTLSEDEFQGLRARLLGDIGNNQFSVLNPTPRDIETALFLVGDQFLTAVDAIHIAMAMNLGQVALISSDDKLNRIARENGLSVFDPASVRGD